MPRRGPSAAAFRWEPTNENVAPSTPCPKRPAPMEDSPAVSPSPMRPKKKARTVEHQLNDVLTAIKATGFENVGSFLAAFTDPEAHYNTIQEVYQSQSAFLQGRNAEGHRPADIVRNMHDHPKSRRSVNAALADIRNTLPSYASASWHSDTATPSSAQPSSSTRHQGARTIGARDALEQWASAVVLRRIDAESSTAIAADHGFRPAAKWTWDQITSFSLDQQRDVLEKTCPTLWAVLMTVATGQTYRDKQASSPPDPDQSDVSLDAAKARDEGRQPWTVCTVAATMLLFSRNHFVSLFPNLIALLLFTCNAGRLVYTALSRFGISVAYPTMLTRLHDLGQDSAKQLRATAAQFRTRPFVPLMDNINKQHKAWRQSLDNRETMRSGTAATMVMLEDVPEGAFDSRPLEEKRQQRQRKNLTMNVLVGDVDQTHLAGVGGAALLRIWTKYIPSLRRFQKEVDVLFRERYRKHRLPLRKTEYHPMKTSGIDESTTAGVADVLENIMCTQLDMKDADFKHILIPVAGDQLTIDRARRLPRYTSKDVTHYSRHRWVLPWLQLWHMKWAFLRCIYRTHWASTTGKGLAGLRDDCQRLNRNKLNPSKCDFYPHDDAVFDTFETLSVGILWHLLELEAVQLDRSLPPFAAMPDSPDRALQLLDALDQTFAAGGAFCETSFAFLESLARKGYNRYLCTAAYETALDVSMRDPAVHGEDGLPVPKDRFKADDKDLEGPAWTGDRVLANTILRCRDCFWYYEMSHAVSDGDIGRVFEIIKVLRFTFWGAGATNYGNEVLELACNFLYEFPEPLKMALMNNWLVNPSGKEGGWHELDLLQEHLNLWIKVLFELRDIDFDSSHVTEAVALNIAGFHQLRERLESITGVPPPGSRHSEPSLVNDINALAYRHYQAEVLTFRAGRRQPWQTADTFSLGYDKLASGQLEVFKNRTLANMMDVQTLESSANWDATFGDDDEGAI